jgi:hypothetical protein
MVAACSSESQARIQQEVDAAANRPVATTVAGVAQVSTDEQAIFAEMWTKATADGALTVAEVRAFAVEAVECTRRAGFEADLHEFNPENASAAFTVAGDGPDEGPEERAATACQDAFYLPAFVAFRDNG